MIGLIFFGCQPAGARTHARTHRAYFKVCTHVQTFFFHFLMCTFFKIYVQFNRHEKARSETDNCMHAKLTRQKRLKQNRIKGHINIYGIYRAVSEVSAERFRIVVCSVAQITTRVSY